jgi:transposase InsO family protein
MPCQAVPAQVFRRHLVLRAAISLASNTATGPNRLWVADATRIPCGESVFWLAAVRDAFSRRIVGWKTSDRCDTDLILAALQVGQ